MAIAVDDPYAWNPCLVLEEAQDEDDDDDNVTVYKELLEEWERFLEDTTKIVIPKRLYQSATKQHEHDDDEESSIVEECRNLYESQEILCRELERIDQVFRHDWSEEDDNEVDGFDTNDTASVSFASSCCQLVDQQQEEEQQQPHEPLREVRHKSNKNRFAICEISVPSLVPLSPVASPCSTISTTTSMMDDHNLDDVDVDDGGNMELCLQPSFELALMRNDGFQPRRNLRKLFLSSSSSSSTTTTSLERPAPPPPPPCAPPPLPPPQDNRRQQQHDSCSWKDTVHQINSGEWNNNNNNKDLDTTRQNVGVVEPNNNDIKKQKRPGFVRSFVNEILFGPPPIPSHKPHVVVGTTMENVCHDKQQQQQQVVNNDDNDDDERDESMSLITLTVAATLLWLPLTIEIWCR